MTEEEIVEYLKDKYEAEMIILHGSRASDNFHSSSDWDLFVFTQEDMKGCPEYINGEHLDVDVISLPLEKDFILETSFAPVENTKVLYDSTGLANKLVEKTKKAREAGPDKLSSQQYTNRKLRLQRILARIEKYQENGPVQFFYLGYFYEFAIRYWFELQQGWSEPVYKAIPIIKHGDSSFFKHLEAIVKEESKIEPAKAIYEALFENE